MTADTENQLAISTLRLILLLIFIQLKCSQKHCSEKIHKSFIVADNLGELCD